MKTQKIDAPNGAIAVHESAGRGPPVVLIHGNSSSSRAFSRQLDGPLGRRFRLIAVDLPGHGASDDAKDPGAYSLPGHARAVRAALDALGIDHAHFVGWSLGGHVALEMAPDLREPRGFVIFGTPPLSSRQAMREAFLPNPAMKFTFQESIDSDEASAYLAAFFGPGFVDIPPFFLDDILRTDGRARSGLAANGANGGYRDEVAVVRDLEVPLAVLHGAEEPIVNGHYFASLVMPTLWRGAVQMIPDAGHTPQWETPQVFDALIETFVRETALTQMLSQQR
jgi:pimeloyl-ACP methyl ester carboxylesterase